MIKVTAKIEGLKFFTPTEQGLEMENEIADAFEHEASQIAKTLAKRIKKTYDESFNEILRETMQDFLDGEVNAYFTGDGELVVLFDLVTENTVTFDFDSLMEECISDFKEDMDEDGGSRNLDLWIGKFQSVLLQLQELKRGRPS